MAMNQKAKVKFSFNGIELEATPESSPPALENEWSAKQEQAAKEYRESPKGIAAAKKRTEEIIRKQRSLNTSLDALSDIIADHDKLMIWLKGVAEDADDIGVQFSKDRLAAQLEAAGFVENEHVGEKPGWFNSRPRMAHYIVGQALNCLRRGMGPHPVTGSFVDRYFTLPKVEDSSPNDKDQATRGA